MTLKQKTLLLFKMSGFTHDRVIFYWPNRPCHGYYEDNRMDYVDIDDCWL